MGTAGDCATAALRGALHAPLPIYLLRNVVSRESTDCDPDPVNKGTWRNTRLEYGQLSCHREHYQIPDRARRSQVHTTTASGRSDLGIALYPYQAITRPQHQ